jgi:hypothetical protein
LLTRKNIKLLSAYLDNEIDSENKIFVESKIAGDKEWSSLYEDLKNTKNYTGNLHDIPPNPEFTNKLLMKIANKQQKYDFLPVPKHLRPAAVLLLVTAVLIFATYIFDKQRDIENFFVENSRVVKNIYESGFIKTDLYPAPIGLTNDDIFQFAVTGALPINTEKDKVFQFGNDKKYGHYFEVGCASPNEKDKPELGIIYEQLQLKSAQIEKIDSVLSAYRKNLETSILVSPKKFLAVDANVWNLKKAIVFDISKNLDEPQRAEFFSLISEAKPPKDIEKYYNSHVDSSLQKFRSKISGEKNFIVMNSDTIMVKSFNVNYDSIEMHLEVLKEEGRNMTINFDSIITTVHGIRKPKISYGHAGHNIVVLTNNLKKVRPIRNVNLNVGVNMDSTICRVEIPQLAVPFPEDFWIDADRAFKTHYDKLVHSREAMHTYSRGMREIERGYKAVDSLYTKDNYKRIFEMLENNFAVSDSMFTIMKDGKNQFNIRINNQPGQFYFNFESRGNSEKDYNNMLKMSRYYDSINRSYYKRQKESRQRENQYYRNKPPRKLEMNNHQDIPAEAPEVNVGVNLRQGENLNILNEIPGLIKKSIPRVGRELKNLHLERKIDSALRIINRINIEIK